ACQIAGIFHLEFAMDGCVLTAVGTALGQSGENGDGSIEAPASCRCKNVSSSGENLHPNATDSSCVLAETDFCCCCNWGLSDSRDRWMVSRPQRTGQSWNAARGADGNFNTGPDDADCGHIAHRCQHDQR